MALPKKAGEYKKMFEPFETALHAPDADREALAYAEMEKFDAYLKRGIISKEDYAVRNHVITSLLKGELLEDMGTADLEKALPVEKPKGMTPDKKAEYDSGIKKAAEECRKILDEREAKKKAGPGNETGQAGGTVSILKVETPAAPTSYQQAPQNVLGQPIQQSVQYAPQQAQQPTVDLRAIHAQQADYIIRYLSAERNIPAKYSNEIHRLIVDSDFKFKKGQLDDSITDLYKAVDKITEYEDAKNKESAGKATRTPRSRSLVDIAREMRDELEEDEAVEPVPPKRKENVPDHPINFGQYIQSDIAEKQYDLKDGEWFEYKGVALEFLTDKVGNDSKSISGWMKDKNLPEEECFTIKDEKNYVSIIARYGEATEKMEAEILALQKETERKKQETIGAKIAAIIKPDQKQDEQAVSYQPPAEPPKKRDKMGSILDDLLTEPFLNRTEKKDDMPVHDQTATWAKRPVPAHRPSPVPVSQVDDAHARMNEYFNKRDGKPADEAESQPVTGESDPMNAEARLAALNGVSNGHEPIKTYQQPATLGPPVNGNQSQFKPSDSNSAGTTAKEPEKRKLTIDADDLSD